MQIGLNEECPHEPPCIIVPWEGRPDTAKGATVKAVLKSVKVLLKKATELTRIAETMAGAV